MYRDADVSALDAAWSDRAQVAELGARLGIELDPVAINGLLRRAGTAVRRRDAIAAILDAATNESGIALHHWDRWLCLAVRDGNDLTFGVAPGTKVSTAWPSLKPWQSFLPSNRKRLEPWAREQLADRVVLALTPIAAPIGDTPPNAEMLIRQVVERPHDRDLRAVLADHLIEHDDMRGKLMRLQLEIEALPATSPDRKKRELVVANLIKSHGARLAGEVAEFTAVYTFAGGFVDSVALTAAAFRDHGARLFAQQPIRRLTLAPSNTQAVATLAKSPAIGLVRELHLYCPDYRRAIDLSALATASLDRLELLELEGMAPIHDAVAFARLQAPRLRSLVCWTHISLATLSGLAASGAPIEELTLRGARVGIRSTYGELPIDELAFPKLRRVLIDHAAVSDACVVRLRERGVDVERW